MVVPWRARHAPPDAWGPGRLVSNSSLENEKRERWAGLGLRLQSSGRAAAAW